MQRHGWQRTGLIIGIALIALFAMAGAGQAASSSSGPAHEPATSTRSTAPTHSSSGTATPSKRKRKARNEAGLLAQAPATAEKPIELLAPVLRGTAVVGQTLTTTNGAWLGKSIVYTYAWKRCNFWGLACTSISGATHPTYTVQSSDVGHSLRSFITATVELGSDPSVTVGSIPTALVTVAVPVVTSPPAISGVSQQGETLTAAAGEWTGSPTSYAYLWEDCAGGTCTPIAGASTTSGTYTLQASDVGATIEVAVAASNAGGAGTPASSAPTQTVLPAVPADATAPAISGTAQQGDTLTAATGTWTNDPTNVTFAWEDCVGGACTPIASASTTSGTYTLQTSDVGATVDVVVTASNAGGTGAPASSAPTQTVLPAIPVDATIPAISGTAQQGDTLTANTGQWLNDPPTYPTSYTFLWQDCVGGACTPIAGASTTSGTYTLQASDVGATVEVVVTASNAGGTGTPASSPATQTVLPAIPVDVTVPAISGTAQQGDTLTATTGTWLNDATSFTYTWEDCTTLANCSPIPGASSTSGAYTLQASDVGDEVQVQVDAGNAGGEALAPATSAPTTPVLAITVAAPADVTAPVVTGTAQQGDMLTASSGTWSGSPTSYVYAWKDCSGSICSAISGATSNTYTLQSGDVGDTVEVAVTASNAGGAGAPASSSPTSTVLPAVPVNTAVPVISGTAQQGDTLTATAGTWTGTPSSYAYAWKHCASGTCTAISGASSTSGTYTLQSGDVGDTIEVAVTATNAGGSGSPATSAATGTVLPAPPANTTLPAITGTAQVGDALTASAGTWTGSPSSYAYAWKDCSGGSCSSISGATSSTYTLQSSDAGDTIEVVVTATNAGGTGAATSAVTATVVASVPVNTAVPVISGVTQQGDTLTVSTGTWTGSPSSYAYAWKRCSGGTCSSISGATSSTYTLQSADVGDTLEAVVTASNSGGAGSAATSPATGTIEPPVPVNSAVPVISGTAQQGDTLTAGTGTWSNSPSSYAYAWKRCSGGTCTAISGASSTSGAYTLQSADVGDTIEVAVTATNAGGSGSPATSAPTGTVLPAPPANTAAPAITGTAQVGDTLTASTGTWTGSPSGYTYVWKDCSGGTCSSISGATSSTYTLQSGDAGDTIEVVVTATNAAGSASATSAATAAVTSSGGGGVDGLHVSGNALATGTGTSGTPVVLHGVDQSGTEYSCTNGYGIFDNGASSVAASASDASDLSVMPSWGINSVFIGLNEDCWLGINGSGIANWSSDSGQNYINAIKAAVTAAESDGVYPVIGFYWGDPGTEIPNGSDPNGGGQPPLPDANHAPLFWEEVANTFKNDPNVIFRLQEEPHPSATGASGAGANTGGNAGTSLYNWQCWAHGSVQYSTSSVASPYNTAPTPTTSNDNCDEYATNATTLYQTVGMQSLINIIRGTGADNVIQVPMLGYANVSDCNYPTQAPAACGFLDSADGVKLSDPIAGTDPAGSQLMADWDIYPDGNQACGTVTCYNDTIAPIAAVMPVDLGEVGPINGTQTGAVTLLNWMDSRSPQGSYYAWAWDTWSDLIANYSGTPDSPWGTAYKNLISATAAPTNTTAPSVTGTIADGDVVTAANGTWTQGGTASYQWQDCTSSSGGCSNISGATGQTYTPVSSDVGDYLDVTVTYTNSYGSASASSAEVGPVQGLAQPTDGITFDQVVASSNSSCDPTSSTLTLNHVTAGDDLFLVAGGLGYTGSASTVNTVSDNKNGSWTRVENSGSQLANIGNEYASTAVYEYTGSAAATSSSPITVTVSSAWGQSGMCCVAVAVKGVASFSEAADTTIQNASTTFTSPVLSSVPAGDVVMGLFSAYSHSGDNPYAPTGWNSGASATGMTARRLRRWTGRRQLQPAARPRRSTSAAPRPAAPARSTSRPQWTCTPDRPHSKAARSSACAAALCGAHVFWLELPVALDEDGLLARRPHPRHIGGVLPNQFMQGLGHLCQIQTVVVEGHHTSGRKARPHEFKVAADILGRMIAIDVGKRDRLCRKLNRRRVPGQHDEVRAITCDFIEHVALSPPTQGLRI